MLKQPCNEFGLDLRLELTWTSAKRIFLCKSVFLEKNNNINRSEFKSLRTNTKSYKLCSLELTRQASSN